SSAIQRSREEKADLSYTYECFAHDLDEGDAFTTSILDLLVNELADRSRRTAGNEKRMISETTARSLRRLSLPNNVYRERRSHSSRRINLTEYLTQPLDLQTEADEDEDAFEAIFENAGNAEARINAHLH
ncbi:hypothetical protein FISHEDRAFT_10313, partial [Fistulina hepatica ATCC 64428]